MENKKTIMQGKIVLVTGATDGIGKITARELAKMGATTVIAGRNPEKTSRTVIEIREASANPNVDLLVGDLSSQADVRRVASEFVQRYDRLDVLVNNAGAYFMKRAESVDGIEMTFALNHLGYFLLTHLLLDALKAGSPARIVNVSSAAHLGARMNLNDLEMKSGFSGWGAYAQSKLANLLFTYELSRQLEGQKITVNALHPGFVDTNFGVSNGGLGGMLISLAQKVGAISPEEGAQTSIYLASSPEVEGISGKYFSKNKVVGSSRISQDQDLARALWERSLELTGLAERQTASR